MAKELAEGLKPCPFCGGKATMSVTQEGKYVIECEYCHSRSYIWQEEAVACMIWNSRNIPEDLIADRWEEAEKLLLQAIKNASFAVTHDKRRLHNE